MSHIPDIPLSTNCFFNSFRQYCGCPENF